MLTEKEKVHIREEEIYRRAVREELKQPLSNKEKVWTFLNSGFCLFLLSAVFIGGLSFLFNAYTEYRNTFKHKVDTIAKITEEVVYRAHFFPVLLKSPFTFSEWKNAEAALTGQEQLRPHGVGRVDEFSPLFTEHKGRSLVSLVWELKNVVSVQHKPEVQAVLELIKQLSPYLEEERLIMMAPVGEEDSKWKMREKEREEFARLLKDFSTHIDNGSRETRWVP